jgi:hypothetical protein
MELIKRIKETANQARMDIIVNVERLKLATPDALKMLVDSDAIPHVKVRFRKLKDAFEASMQGFSRSRLEHLKEDLQDA